MTTAMQTMGVNAFRDTLKNGGCVASLLNDLYIDATQGTTDIFVGAVVCLLSTYTAVRDAGLAPHVDDSDLDKFLHSASSAMSASLTQKMAQVLGNHDEANAWMEVRLSAMARVVVAHRDKITWPEPVATAPPVPEPVAVRVVGLPDRSIESTVKYDADGNIKSTVQTERDVPPPKV